MANPSYNVAVVQHLPSIPVGPRNTTECQRYYPMILRGGVAVNIREWNGTVVADIVDFGYPIFQIVSLTPEDDIYQLFEKINKTLANDPAFKNPNPASWLKSLQVCSGRDSINLNADFANGHDVMEWLRQTNGRIEVNFCAGQPPSLEEVRIKGTSINTQDLYREKEVSSQPTEEKVIESTQESWWCVLQ